LFFSNVEDGEVDRIEFEGDGLRFAGSESHAIPGDEAFEGGLAGCGGQNRVDLGDFSSRAIAAVAHGEGDLVLRGLQIREFIRGVGESEAEGEEGLLLFRLKPFVTDADTFCGGRFEEGQFAGTVMTGAWVLDQVHTGDLRVRQLRVGFREGDGEAARGIDFAEEDAGQRLGAAYAGVPGFNDALDAIDPGHADGATAFDDDDGVWIGGGDGIDEAVLVVRQRDGCGVHAFAQGLIDEDNGDLRSGSELCGRSVIGAGIELHFGVGRVFAHFLHRRGRKVNMLHPDGGAGMRIDGVAAGGIDLG
jgi:hypothetical protein